MSHDLPPSSPEEARTSVIEACVHLDAGARLIEAGCANDPFHPDMALAAQVTLLAAAIQPGIQASEDPDDPWDASGHVDHALTLLGSLPPDHVSVEQRRRCAQLAQLRHAIEAAGAHSPENEKHP